MKVKAFLLVRNDIWQWQELQINSGPNMPFYQFCDALEVKNGKSAPKSGWGLAHALQAWGQWFKTTTLPGCKITFPLFMSQSNRFRSVFSVLWIRWYRVNKLTLIDNTY